MECKLLRMESKQVQELKATLDARRRVQLSLSEPVQAILAHIEAQLGLTRTQVCEMALMEALPALLERADLVKRRSGELLGPQRKK